MSDAARELAQLDAHREVVEWRHTRQASAAERVARLERALETAVRDEREARERVNSIRMRLRALPLTFAHVDERHQLSQDEADAKGAAERAASAQIRARKSLDYWTKRQTVAPFGDRVPKCDTHKVTYKCRDCGHQRGSTEHCDVRALCTRCAAREAKRNKRKLLGALTKWEGAERDRYRERGYRKGDRRVLTMLTLTLRSHTSLDLGERRALLSESWHRFQMWLVRRWCREERARREKAAWRFAVPGGRHPASFPPPRENMVYAWVVEITPGTREQGHVHMHVATFLPYVDFRDLHAEWTRATRSKLRITVDVRQKVKDPNPKKCARYLAKYVSKQANALPLDLRAKWIVAQHAKRKISSSRGFWLPPDSSCEACGVAPLSTVRVVHQGDENPEHGAWLDKLPEITDPCGSWPTGPPLTRPS